MEAPIDPLMLDDRGAAASKQHHDPPLDDHRCVVIKIN